MRAGEIADWFAARGFRAFVLSYRLSSNGYLLPVPLLDARRAIQTVRARANDYHIDPNRIVVIGFSAGGHLAALAGTQFVPGNPDADDPIDRASSRPDFLVLGYPWIGAISSDTSHLSYCKLLNVMDQCEALRAKFDPVLYRHQEHAAHVHLPHFRRPDRSGRAEPGASTRRWSRRACRRRCTSSPTAGTARGLGKGDPALDQWPNLLEIWLRGQGLLTVDKAAVGAKP